MIKVVLQNKKPVDVVLHPKQGIQIEETKKYLFDPAVVQKYVDASAENAEIAIEKAAEAQQTFSDITVFVDNSKQQLNQIVADGEVAIDGYVDEAEQEIKQIAQQAAEDAIQGAADEATRRAINQTTELVDNEIEPRLREYASNAEADATNAAESAEIASVAASDANHYSEDARIWAEGEQAEVEEIGGELSSRGFADFAYAIANTPEDVPLDQSKLIALNIVKGPKGDKGDKGDKGEDGIKGALNNPFSLFDVKWSDHKLDNASWALADGSYVPRSNYVTAYEELVSEYNQGTPSVDGSVNYMLTPKGYKIALVDQETAIDELFASKGVAWYYILDSENQQFKLPRTKWGFVGVRGGAGNYVSESLPNITGQIVSGDWDDSHTSGCFAGVGNTSAANGTDNRRVTNFNASRSSSAYKDGAPVQQRSTEMYLYFYVGETIVGANIIDYTRELNEVVDSGIDRITQLSDTKIAEVAQASDNELAEIAQAGDTELAEITQAGEDGAELVRNTVEAILTGDKVLEGSLLIQTPPADDNSQRAVNSEWVNNALKDVGPSGGGLEIGDIGFAPLGVDESQNKRRYLNGQVISQEQFVSFTNKIKDAIALYPSLGATEENWQAEVTNSKLGQCGKFVIDDALGTIRLPKVVNVQGLSDLSLMGSVKAESLPNIKGTVIARVAIDSSGSGATSGSKVSDWGLSGGGDADAYKTTFNASLSSSTYQDNAPVQQEAIQYPYFIQVATGVEETVDVTREIELNNPFSLLDYKWSEYEINNASWLLSNSAFHSGTVYKSVYELLLKIKNGAVTKEGVSVKLASEEYSDTDFVLNTIDTTFRLPVKVKQRFFNSGDVAVVGNGMTLGLTNGSSNGGLNGYYNDFWRNLDQTLYGKNVGTAGSSQWGQTNKSVGVTTDASKSGLVAKLSSSEVNGLYLYFYVGETIQDANVINASGVLTEIANADYVVDSYRSGYNWYRIYKSGWIEQGGRTESGTASPVTVELLKTMSDSKYCLYATANYITTSSGTDTRNVSVGNPTVNSFMYTVAMPSTPSASTVPVYWEVKGQGAK